MKVKKRIGFVILVVILFMCLVAWAYRNPIVRYAASGELKNMEPVIIATYGPLPLPEDIQTGLTEWQNTLGKQYEYYRTKYSEFEVTYSTQINSSETIVFFTGEGTLLEDGEKQEILDTIVLEFKLYK